MSSRSGQDALPPSCSNAASATAPSVASGAERATSSASGAPVTRARKARVGRDSGERPAVYVHDWALPPGNFDIRVAVRDSAFYRAGEKFAVQLNDTGSWEAAHHRTVARRP